MSSSDTVITLMTLKVPFNKKNEFLDWQAQFHAEVASFCGFVSLEILSPKEEGVPAWTFVLTFSNKDYLNKWRTSIQRKNLFEHLEKIIGTDLEYFLSESNTCASKINEGVTEVFVTQVVPQMEATYRQWIAKIHQAESQCVGFRGVYVQAPREGESNSWITLLQFDTQANLEKWLASPQRAALLKESKSSIASIEGHRVISPYGGWFSSIAKNGQIPPTWKQSMIVLLALFPIVMLENAYLRPWTASLNISLAMFIGNALSVTLLAWPVMPLAIRILHRWLTQEKNIWSHELMWLSLILLIYGGEISLFYMLSK